VLEEWEEAAVRVIDRQEIVGNIENRILAMIVTQKIGPPVVGNRKSDFSYDRNPKNRTTGSCRQEG
jgi:hypothetical protein